MIEITPLTLANPLTIYLRELLQRMLEIREAVVSTILGTG